MSSTEPKPRKKPATKSASEAKPAPEAKPKKTASSAASKSTTKTSSKPVKIKALDASLRHKLITETAHYLSEKRCGGANEMDDWLFAEKLVDGVNSAVR